MNSFYEGLHKENEVEEEIVCDLCGDAGVIVKGFHGDDNELIVTKTEPCTCRQD